MGRVVGADELVRVRENARARSMRAAVRSRASPSN